MAGIRFAQTANPSPCTLTPFGWYTSWWCGVGSNNLGLKPLDLQSSPEPYGSTTPKSLKLSKIVNE